MTPKEFQAVLDSRFVSTQAVLGTKAGEYASDNDRLYNFKRGAGVTGETPIQVCVGYMTKHLVSVLDMVDRESRGTLPTPAQLEEKFGDLTNYVILLEALFREKMGEQQPTQTDNDTGGEQAISRRKSGTGGGGGGGRPR